MKAIVKRDERGERGERGESGDVFGKIAVVPG
jgi:hypothetical protein